MWKKDETRLKAQFRELKDLKDIDELKNIVKNSCTHYLEDTGCEIMGYKIWGSP